MTEKPERGHQAGSSSEAHGAGRIESELRGSEELYRALVGALEEGVVCQGSDGAIMDCNPSAERILGLSLDQMRGRTSTDPRWRAVHPDGRPFPGETHPAMVALRTGKPVTGVVMGVARSEEELVWISINSRPLFRAGDPRPYAVVTSFFDVTGARLAGETVRRNEELLRKVLDALPVGIWIVEKGGKIVRGNASGQRIWAGTKYVGIEEYKQYKGWWRDTGKKIEPEEWAAARAITRGDTTLNEEIEIESFDGTHKIILNSAIPIRDELGQITAAIIVNEDVTERRRLEDQLRQSTKMEAIGRLAGGVAHDFNNLLTAILGYGDLLLGRVGPNDPMRGDLEEIRRSAERAAALTRQLLAFSRRQVLAPQVIDLNAVVSGLQNMLQRLMGEDIVLASDLASDLGLVRADPAQIEQVLVNLGANARDAMPRGGRLTVQTCNARLEGGSVQEHVPVTPGPYVLLAVADTGQGMDEKTRAHIFEPFFTTKERGRGTGLGLSTVYGIVKQSGGYVWVDSEPGKGSTFRIYLPRVDGDGSDPRPWKAPGA